ncbi:MAG: hypothetical protein V7739_03895 [Motiliproteus sp.]
MFNLLVTGAGGWNSSRDTISSGRTLEYIAQHLLDRFAPGGVLDITEVTQLPTIFACENSWDGSHQPARVGILIRVQLIGTEYRLEYVFDPDIPPIPNEVLFGSAASDLDINTTASIPESSRNHWSIKDVDLYRTLLKHEVGKRPQAKVFDLPDVAVDSNLVAVMMPFDASFNPVYDALRGGVESLGMTCQRADDIWVNDHVVQDVALLLSKAKVVICDLSGRNANVFYETGIAHTLGKDVILIARSETDIPFDVAAIRHIKYLPNGEGLEKLRVDVQRRISTLSGRQ